MRRWAACLGVVLAALSFGDGLHLSVFEDYAKGLVVQGWKLEMDRSIARRPVVWTLVEREGGLADLKRSCELLDLTCFVDAEKRKVFISGPTAESGGGLANQIRLGLERDRKEVTAGLAMSAAAVSSRWTMLSALLQQGSLSPEEATAAERELQILVGLMDREDRVVAAQIAGMDPVDLAARLEREGTIRVSLGPQAQKAWAELARLGQSPLFNTGRMAVEDPEVAAAMEADNKEFVAGFRKAMAANPTVEVWISASDLGEVQGQLVLFGDDLDYRTGMWWARGVRNGIEGEADVKFEEMMEVLTGAMEKPEAAVVPGELTLNMYADSVVGKGSSAAWLQGPMSPYFRMLSDEDYMKFFSVRQYEDGWLQLFERRRRFPHFGEGWRPLIGWFDVARDGVSVEDVKRWCLGTSVDDMRDASSAIETSGYRSEGVEWVRRGLLVQAAVLEIERSGEAEIETTVSRLDAKAQRSVMEFLDSPEVWRSFPSLGRELHRRKRGDYGFKVQVGDGSFVVELETSYVVEGHPLVLRAVVPITEK